MEQMQRPKVIYSAELRESCRGGGRRIRENSRVRDTMKRRVTESTDWDSCGLTEISEHVGVWPRSSVYTLWLSSWCSCEFPNSGSRFDHWLFCLLMEPFFSYWIVSFSLDCMCMVLFSNVLVCVWLKSLGGLFFSSGEKKSGRERREVIHGWDVIYERLIIIIMKSQMSLNVYSYKILYIKY